MITEVDRPLAKKDGQAIGLAVSPDSPSSVLAKLDAVRDPEIQKRVMASMGRKGGRIGGRVRAEKLSPERRREIAMQAARKRWGGVPPAQAKEALELLYAICEGPDSDLQGAIAKAKKLLSTISVNNGHETRRGEAPELSVVDWLDILFL